MKSAFKLGNTILLNVIYLINSNVLISSLHPHYNDTVSELLCLPKIKINLVRMRDISACGECLL